jgi:hypothetical protein
LLREGSTPCQISGVLGIHPDIVRARVAKLERNEEGRREFMQTMKLPGEGEGGYLAIFQ